MDRGGSGCCRYHRFSAHHRPLAFDEYTAQPGLRMRRPVFVDHFFMLSLDMVFFFMSSAKAPGASGAKAKPMTIAADKSVVFFMRHTPKGFTLRFLGYH